MKKSAFIFLSFLLIGNMYGKEKTIELPPYIMSNTRTIEIEKIVLNDTATILYMKGYERPSRKLTLQKGNFLVADDGKEYKIKSVQGITPGKGVKMPESGETDFQLIFPPLPKNIKSFDFYEGERSNYWKIWGISLTGKLPKQHLPKELLKQHLDYDAPLPELIIKEGKATICGKLLEYRPEMKLGGLKIDFFNLLTKEYQNEQAKIATDGSFKKVIELLAPTLATLRLGEKRIAQIYIAPDKTTDLTINLREVCRKTSQLRNSQAPYGKSVYFNGYMAPIHAEMEKYNQQTDLDEDYYGLLKEIKNLDAIQCRDYFLSKRQLLHQEIDKIKASDLYKNRCKALVDLSCANLICQSPTLPIVAYTYNNKMEDEERDEYWNKHSKVNLPDGYFDCLKQLNVANSFWLTTEPYIIYKLGQNLVKPDYIAAGISILNQGILKDLTTAQRIGIQVTSSFISMNEEQFKELSQLSNPVYLKYLTTKNKELLALIEANKEKRGYTVNDIGEVSNEDLFYSMTSKFRGKVVLVDFWATWCAPCRHAMKQMEPMKEQLKDKDIVYIYITGETSPKAKWENMIPDIHGEHFRVTDKQWKYLNKEFKIQGIPTYLIIDKEGGITYKATGFPGTTKMKKELLKAMDK